MDFFGIHLKNRTLSLSNHLRNPISALMLLKFWTWNAFSVINARNCSSLFINSNFFEILGDIIWRFWVSISKFVSFLKIGPSWKNSIWLCFFDVIQIESRLVECLVCFLDVSLLAPCNLKEVQEVHMDNFKYTKSYKIFWNPPPLADLISTLYILDFNKLCPLIKTCGHIIWWFKRTINDGFLSTRIWVFGGTFKYFK